MFLECLKRERERERERERQRDRDRDRERERCYGVMVTFVDWCNKIITQYYVSIVYAQVYVRNTGKKNKIY